VGLTPKAITCANDEDQAQSRSFQAASRIVQATPWLERSANVTQSKIEFSNGSALIALANDFRGASGANPNFIDFDELWGFTSENAHRFWDEMAPVPTRKVSVRLTTTYAGYQGESILLENLYKRGLKGKEISKDLYEQPGMLMYWTNECVAPWQTQEWVEQMREQLRPNAFLRMIQNQWVSTESTFVEMEWWDACVQPGLTPVAANLRLPIWCGLDASTKKDSTGIAACSWDDRTKRVRLVYHKIFQPNKEKPLDFEATIEEELRMLKRRFNVREIRYDPYQMVSSAQRLEKEGLPMVEFPQSVPNLTEASQNLYDLIKGRNLEVYADADIRLAVSRAVAVETARGWRITKEKSSHKIDVLVALAQAALGAVRGGQGATCGIPRFTSAGRRAWTGTDGYAGSGGGWGGLRGY
jgi:phage terminase large subunit-like protein